MFNDGRGETEMTDEQILRLICDHTGKRINLCNFTLDELKVFARAVESLVEARAKLERAKGMPDLAMMVEASKGYDGPEVSGSGIIRTGITKL